MTTSHLDRWPRSRGGDNQQGGTYARRFPRLPRFLLPLSAGCSPQNIHYKPLGKQSGICKLHQGLEGLVCKRMILNMHFHFSSKRTEEMPRRGQFIRFPFNGQRFHEEFPHYFVVGFR